MFKFILIQYKVLDWVQNNVISLHKLLADADYSDADPDKKHYRLILIACWWAIAET